MITAAIMQPTFLPWLGYFALIDAVDHFVFLDEVQFSKQSWQSRNRIKGPDGPIMLSLGVARKPSKPLINEARLADTGFEQKLIKSIDANLCKAPYFDLVRDIVNHGFETANSNLCALNVGIITAICNATGIDTEMHMASELDIKDQTTKSGKLIAICERFSADVYLSPVGSYDYLAEENIFEHSPVGLEFLNYRHPEYQQNFGAFQSHLAAIDALAYTGADGFLPLLRSGVGQALSFAEISRIG